MANFIQDNTNVCRPFNFESQFSKLEETLSTRKVEKVGCRSICNSFASLWSHAKRGPETLRLKRMVRVANLYCKNRKTTRMKQVDAFFREKLGSPLPHAFAEFLHKNQNSSSSKQNQRLKKLIKLHCNFERTLEIGNEESLLRKKKQIIKLRPIENNNKVIKLWTCIKKTSPETFIRFGRTYKHEQTPTILKLLEKQQYARSLAVKFGLPETFVELFLSISSPGALLKIVRQRVLCRHVCSELKQKLEIYQQLPQPPYFNAPYENELKLYESLSFGKEMENSTNDCIQIFQQLPSKVLEVLVKSLEIEEIPGKVVPSTERWSETHSHMKGPDQRGFPFLKTVIGFCRFRKALEEEKMYQSEWKEIQKFFSRKILLFDTGTFRSNMLLASFEIAFPELEFFREIYSMRGLDPQNRNRASSKRSLCEQEQGLVACLLEVFWNSVANVTCSMDAFEQRKFLPFIEMFGKLPCPKLFSHKMRSHFMQGNLTTQRVSHLTALARTVQITQPKENPGLNQLLNHYHFFSKWFTENFQSTFHERKIAYMSAGNVTSIPSKKIVRSLHNNLTNSHSPLFYSINLPDCFEKEIWRNQIDDLNMMLDEIIKGILRSKKSPITFFKREP